MGISISSSTSKRNCFVSRLCSTSQMCGKSTCTTTTSSRITCCCCCCKRLCGRLKISPAASFSLSSRTQTHIATARLTTHYSPVECMPASSHFLVVCYFFLLCTFFNHFAFASSLYPSSPTFGLQRELLVRLDLAPLIPTRLVGLLTTVATTISHFHCPYCTLTNARTRFHSSSSTFNHSFIVCLPLL